MTPPPVYVHAYAVKDPSSRTALPIYLLDDRGVVIGADRILTGGQRPSRIDPDSDAFPRYVRVDLPNGNVLVKPVSTNENSPVTFVLGYDSPRETMSWAAPRVDFSPRAEVLALREGMQSGWIQLWQLGTTGWRQLPLHLHGRFDAAPTALELRLTDLREPGALVINTGQGVPQVISLPASAKLRALITTTEVTQGTWDTQVVLGGYGPRTEGVLEFLRKGALDSAEALDPGMERAMGFLYEKQKDPLAATAGAYYLLRRRAWDRLPLPWLKNLANRFKWIPDAHLLLACVQIREGMNNREAGILAGRAIEAAFTRGFPLFFEARGLLQELHYYASRSEGRAPNQLAFVGRVLACAQPAGISFGFSGLTPFHPTREVPDPYLPVPESAAAPRVAMATYGVAGKQVTPKKPPAKKLAAKAAAAKRPAAKKSAAKRAAGKPDGRTAAKRSTAAKRGPRRFGMTAQALREVTPKGLAYESTRSNGLSSPPLPHPPGRRQSTAYFKDLLVTA